MSTRVREILARLPELDVLNTHYPGDVTTANDRRRWNQSRLIALALYRSQIPSMLPAEYSQELYLMASSIYRQDAGMFPTGSDAELAEEIADAVARGWL